MGRRFLCWFFIHGSGAGFFLYCAILFGLLPVLGGGARWWWDRYYDADGVLTDSGVVMEKRKKESEDYDPVQYLIKYRFSDQSGRTHVFEECFSEETGIQLDVGDRLPRIEYLSSDPNRHRPASYRGSGPIYFWRGVTLLGVMFSLRLIYWMLIGRKGQTVQHER